MTRLFIAIISNKTSHRCKSSFRPLSNATNLLKTYTDGPVASDGQRHQDMPVSGQLICLQLDFTPSICIHYVAWHQTLSKIIVNENASHPVIPTCGRHYHTCRMTPVMLLGVVQALVEYTRTMNFP